MLPLNFFINDTIVSNMTNTSQEYAMHNIYNYNRTISQDKKDIFNSLEDDDLILDNFSLLSGLEYLNQEKRVAGTQFLIHLNIKGKIYRFKSKINNYNEPESVAVETYTKYGTIYSQLALSETNDGTEVVIHSDIDNLNFMTKTVLVIMQPILKRALNRSIDNFLNRLENIYT